MYQNINFINYNLNILALGALLFIFLLVTLVTILYRAVVYGIPYMVKGKCKVATIGRNVV